MAVADAVATLNNKANTTRKLKDIIRVHTSRAAQ
jgi:hypothetical protein